MAEQAKKIYYYTEKSKPPEKNQKFWASADDIKFMDADPLTEEEKQEAAQIWDQLTQGKASPGKKV